MIHVLLLLWSIFTWSISSASLVHAFLDSFAWFTFSFSRSLVYVASPSSPAPHLLIHVLRSVPLIHISLAHVIRSLFPWFIFPLSRFSLIHILPVHVWPRFPYSCLQGISSYNLCWHGIYIPLPISLEGTFPWSMSPLSMFLAQSNVL